MRSFAILKVHYKFFMSLSLENDLYLLTSFHLLKICSHHNTAGPELQASWYHCLGCINGVRQISGNN